MRHLNAWADLLPGPVCGPRPYTPLCVLSTARSGSNFLIHTLRMHPAVFMYGEAFSHVERVREIAMWPDKQRRPHYGGGSVRRFLEGTVFPPEKENRLVVGFKLFPDHAKWLPYPQRFWRLLDSVPGLKVLELERENLLDVILSLRLAVRDKSWYVTPAMQPPLQEPIWIDYDYCVGALQKLRREREASRKRLPHADRMRVTYDSLSHNTPSCAEEIYAWLGVPGGYRAPAAGPVRQRRVPRSEAIANFDELRSRIDAESPEWLSYFDEPEPAFSR